MSLASAGSLDPINRSDSSSRTESDELTSPRPEQDDDVAQSPFVPQRARLMPGGPPVYLGEPLHIDVPRFLVGPNRRAVPGQSPPGEMLLELSFCSTNNSRELLVSAIPIGTGPTTYSNAASAPTFHSDIDALEASLLCLKHQSIELGRLPVPSRMSRGHRQTTEKTDGCIRLWRSLEPEGFVTPALLRARSSKNQDLACKSSRGALPILVASLTATIAYLMTGGWTP